VKRSDVINNGGSREPNNMVVLKEAPMIPPSSRILNRNQRNSPNEVPDGFWDQMQNQRETSLE